VPDAVVSLIFVVENRKIGFINSFSHILLMGPNPKLPPIQTANCGNAQQPAPLSYFGVRRLIHGGGAQPNPVRGGIVTPWGEPASEYLRRQEGKVEYVELFTSAGVQKDYGPFLMVYDGWKFKKCPHMVEGYEDPSTSEIRRFKQDVAEAAQTDVRIAMLINHEPKLQESFPPDGY
jgi:hypothetical protein